MQFMIFFAFNSLLSGTRKDAGYKIGEASMKWYETVNNRSVDTHSRCVANWTHLQASNEKGHGEAANGGSGGQVESLRRRKEAIDKLVAKSKMHNTDANVKWIKQWHIVYSRKANRTGKR